MSQKVGLIVAPSITEVIVMIHHNYLYSKKTTYQSNQLFLIKLENLLITNHFFHLSIFSKRTK